MPGVSAGLTSPTVNMTISAATTNATLVKAGPGELRGYVFANQGGGWAFVKLYNKATAPTVGTDVPFLTIGLPPAGAGHISLGDDGMLAFGTGLGFAITGDEAIIDTTAVVAGQVVLNLLYG